VASKGVGVRPRQGSRRRGLQGFHWGKKGGDQKCQWVIFQGQKGWGNRGGTGKKGGPQFSTKDSGVCHDQRTWERGGQKGEKINFTSWAGWGSKGKTKGKMEHGKTTI